MQVNHCPLFAINKNSIKKIFFTKLARIELGRKLRCLPTDETKLVSEACWGLN